MSTSKKCQSESVRPIEKTFNERILVKLLESQNNSGAERRKKLVKSWFLFFWDIDSIIIVKKQSLSDHCQMKMICDGRTVMIRCVGRQ